MRRRAFTLVEMLVVVAIISILLSFLLPTMGKMRELANQAVCRSNLRQLSLAFVNFATNHGGHLPGGGCPPQPGNTWTGVDKDKLDWLQGSNVDVLSAAPEQGTLWPYVNNRKVYRCKSLRTVNVGAGSGCSNGIFDYTAFLCFSGADLTGLPHEAKFTYPDGHFEMVPLPLIVEEDPGMYMNTTTWPDGGHSSGDKMGSTHVVNGVAGAFYASKDGSVNFFSMPDGTTTYNWSAMGPKKTFVGMEPYYADWGWWDNHP